MIFKKDNFILGCILGLIAPIVGLCIFKFYKFENFGFKDTWDYMRLEPGHKTISAALSISLLLNALFFTIYINTSRDKTAKGIFAVTVVYGLIVLSIKTFS